MYQFEPGEPGNRLVQVLVIAHSTTIIGIYEGGVARPGVLGMRKVCDCIECPDGAIVCGCPPACPPDTL